MIIVEGPDGAGKTTLIRTLAKEFDVPVAPRVVGKDTKSLTDLRQWVEDNVTQGWQHRIFDRHRLISQPIYGPILHRAPHDEFVDRAWLAHWYAEFLKIEPVIIYCLPSLEIVRHNCMNDPDNDNSAVLPYIDYIYAAYAAKATTDALLLPGQVVVYDYTVDSSTDAFEFVHDLLVDRLVEGIWNR